jgi:endonuclease/exonuclease/phosphatase (EEP) superfamily protein YafD
MILIAGLAALIAGLTLIAFFGGLLWVADLIAAFRPQLTLGLIALVVLLAVGKWRRSAAVLGGIAILNVAVIAPLFLPPQRDGNSDLRIVSYNLLASNENYEQVIDFLRESEADLVVLHEASLPWEEAIAEADLGYALSVNRHPDDIFSSMVLAPAGATVESFGFRIDDPRAVAIGMPSGVTVLAIHPLSPYNEERAELRDRQLQWAGDWVEQQPGPVVVTGDFNAGPFSFPYRRLRAETKLLDSARGYGLELSYPAEATPLLQVSIDHLLYSDSLSVVDRVLGPPMGSDHYPLTVDLAVDS